ncbi:MAG: cell envelope integrity protein TolA [Xanthomonadales bacterium]|nr:cell envelope integrity protein TolA [Xanthomonadales bacterium]
MTFDFRFDFREFGRQAQAFGLALSVHVIAAVFVVLGTMEWVPFRQQQPVGLLIEAVIVDTSTLQEQRDAARQAAEREELRQERARELEAQRQREQERQQELEQQRRERELEEQRRRQEQDRLDQIRREREARLEAERLKQERELQRIREEREKAEREAKLAEERLKQLEAQRQREADQQRLAAEAEAQRQAQQQAEFQAGQVATKRDEYVIAIRRIVTQNWLRPPTAQPGLNCRVDVVQIPGGEVISANVRNPCNADPVTRRSIIDAVERVGALPYRGFEDVFEREISFYFIYDGD